jgi:aminopeptidase N
LFLDSYIATANTEQAFVRLSNALETEQGPAGIELDQDLRWNMLAKLQQFQTAASAELLLAEQQRDDSAQGQQQALRAQVLGSAPKEKMGWLDTAVRRDESYRLINSRIILANLYPVNQRYLMQDSADNILQRLPELEAQQDVLFFRHTARSLIPRVCTAANQAALNKVIESDAVFTRGIEKALLVARQLEQRCLTMRSYNKNKP